MFDGPARQPETRGTTVRYLRSLKLIGSQLRKDEPKGGWELKSVVSHLCQRAAARVTVVRYKGELDFNRSRSRSSGGGSVDGSYGDSGIIQKPRIRRPVATIV